jgi:hypothetical protein
MTWICEVWKVLLWLYSMTWICEVRKVLLCLPLGAGYMISRTSPPRCSDGNTYSFWMRSSDTASCLCADTEVHFDTFRTALLRRVETVPCIQEPKTDQKAVRTGWWSCSSSASRAGGGGLLRHQSQWWRNTFWKWPVHFWNTCGRTWLLPVRNNSVKHGSTNTFTRKSCWQTM